MGMDMIQYQPLNNEEEPSLNEQPEMDTRPNVKPPVNINT